MKIREIRAACATLAAACSLLLVAQNASAITVASARGMTLGSTVTLTDVIITNLYDTTFSSGVRTIHLQDATGGITVAESQGTLNALLVGYVEGDSIDITGPTGAFNGLLQLGFGVGPIVDNGFVGVPSPLEITPADLVNLSSTGESLESELVVLKTVTFTGFTPGDTFAGGTNYTVTDGSDSGIVRVANDIGTPHPLQGQLIPSGPVTITGIFSQFDSSVPDTAGGTGGYQVLVLTVVPEPSTIALLALGAIGALGLFRRRKA